MNKHDLIDERKRIAQLLRALAVLIEKSDSGDLDSLIKGKMSLAISKPKAEREVLSSKTEKRSLFTLDIVELATTLQTLQSREEGVDLLVSARPSRSDLAELARYLGLPVLRNDTVEHFIEKIVEACIGSRLASHAIRGEAITD